MDARIDGGDDFQSAQLDVLFFQNQLEVVADRIHRMRLARFTPPLRPHLNRLELRRIRLLASDGFSNDHALQRRVALARRRLDRTKRIERIRPAHDACQQCRLRKRELRRMLLEVDPRGLADAFDLSAPVDLVDVGFEQFIFRVGRLEAKREGHLEQLAVDLAHRIAAFFATLELVNVGCELLRDRRGPFAFALQVLESGAHDADRIDAAVLVKPLVFARENRLAEKFRHLRERHDRSLLAVNAADLDTHAIADDRPLRHRMDFCQIVMLRPKSINHRKDQREVQPRHQGVADQAGEHLGQQTERASEKTEEIKRPQKQEHSTSPPSGDGGRGLIPAPPVVFLLFCHRCAEIKRSGASIPSRKSIAA